MAHTIGRELLTIAGLQIERETYQEHGETDTREIYRLQTAIACEDRPLEWQRRGLQETATGYGRKLTTTRIAILPGGQSRRIYVTQFSNAGSAWIVLQGIRVYVSDGVLVQPEDGDTVASRQAMLDGIRRRVAPATAERYMYCPAHGKIDGGTAGRCPEDGCTATVATLEYDATADLP